VSVVSQDAPRHGQGVSGNSEPSLDSIEDRAATWMDSPKGDVLPFCPREQYGQSFRKMITDGSGDLAGKMHLETRCADAPGDELGGVRQYRRSEIDHFKSGGLAADNAGCTAIRELQGREQFVEPVAFLQVQRAQLDCEDENPSLAIRTEDMASE